jgi:SAM-dependent methyltransferase
VRSLAAWFESGEHRLRLKSGLLASRPVAAAVGLLDRRRLGKLQGDLQERSKRRWRTTTPTTALTWGTEVSGAPLLAKAVEYGVFGPGRTVLEVGPGYGRLLRSALQEGAEFERYVALDISEANVSHLRREFTDERVEIVCGDAETASLPAEADALVSFLTFKHFYPSFEPALANLVPQLSAGAVVVFDLLEGGRRHFQVDDVTYVREYSRDEVPEILARTSLVPVALDEVVHAPGRARLLVVARRQPPDG